MIHQVSNIIIPHKETLASWLNPKRRRVESRENNKIQASSDKRSWRSLIWHESLVGRSLRKIGEGREKEAWGRREKGERKSLPKTRERKDKEIIRYFPSKNI
jgi:hypothetical protein